MRKMSFSYNFPGIKEEKVMEEDLLEKLHEELTEIDEAREALRSVICDYVMQRITCDEILPESLLTIEDIAEAEYHLLEEVLDLYHATETVLRVFPAEKVWLMRNKVIAKNEKRGYYKED